jgi:NAD(P)-dependent dehydrogenase (short-subunit alcohol dehydrogenase family)
VRVVITGASSGIGEALARHYAAQGAVLGLVSRRETRTPAQGASYPVDITDEAALARVARDFIDRFGVPDLVIANAASRAAPAARTAATSPSCARCSR